MQLSVGDASRLLNVPERTLFRWIREGSIPACKVGDDYRFNRVELMEWATRERISVSPDFFQGPEGDESLVSVAQALREGGVHEGIPGDDRESILRSVVARLRLPASVDREFLVSILMAREWMGSTGVGEGIAIPHVRDPLVLEISRPQIALCYLDHPVDFGALDGRPVTVLFTLLSPTVRAHLQILSRLAFLLKDPEFRESLQRQPALDEVLRLAGVIESRLRAKEGDGPEAPDSGGRLTRY